MNRLAPGATAALLCWIAPEATAQFLNVDVSAGAGGPSPAFGGAALMDGTWNTVVGQLPHLNLLDRLGAPTNVTVQVFNSGNLDGRFDHPATTGDVGSLLDDWRVALWFATFNEVVVLVSGLQPGLYEVTTYAWAADDPGARMTVYAPHFGPPVETGGPWPGEFVEGITHARQVAEVATTGPGSTLIIRVVSLGDRNAALNGFQLIPLDNPAAATFCTPQSTNSTGVAAELTMLGSDVVSDDFLVADCRELPTHSFAYLLASQTQGFVPMAGGSQGNLCLGGGIARFVGQIRDSGPAGVFRVELDLSAFPLNPPQPGDTWHFQVWYRDLNPGPTSNFSTGYTFQFQ